MELPRGGGIKNPRRTKGSSVTIDQESRNPNNREIRADLPTGVGRNIDYVDLRLLDPPLQVRRDPYRPQGALPRQKRMRIEHLSPFSSSLLQKVIPPGSC